MKRWWDVKNKKWRSSWALTDEILTQIDNILENAGGRRRWARDCYEISEKPSDWSDEWLMPCPTRGIRPYVDEMDLSSCAGGYTAPMGSLCSERYRHLRSGHWNIDKDVPSTPIRSKRWVSQSVN
jgi:hypothetical protein